MNDHTERAIMDLYDEYVRSVDDPAGVKVSEAKAAIRDEVRTLVAVDDRDVDAETDTAINAVVGAERSRRSRSIKKRIDYLLDGLGEDGTYIDPLLDMAFSLGDEHGTDKALRNWTKENIADLTVTRYRVSAEATKAAAEFDQSAQRLVAKMRATSAGTVGQVPWSA